ncbi:MAG: hypothetical protein ACI4QR_01420 [Eubacteriales bacterium]
MTRTGEKTELTQKYCSHIADNVTLISQGETTSCLSSHLCRGENGKNCDHYNGEALLWRQPYKDK